MDHAYIEYARDADAPGDLPLNSGTETLARPASLWAYISLTKPGIVLGNALTAFGGFALAAQGQPAHPLLFPTLLGLMLIMASACVCNNIADRAQDAKMARTKERPLAAGVVSPRQALLFAVALFLLGTLILGWGVHFLALALAWIAYAIYVFLYRRAKRRSPLGIVVGSLAGAMPPVIGYCALAQRIDGAACLLFAMLYAWQMPHFFALSIMYMRDYAAAALPVLPTRKGLRATKQQMVLYAAAFALAAPLLALCGYASRLYFWIALALGGGWVLLCLQGLRTRNDQLWAYRVFFYSLVAIVGLSLAMALCR